MDFSAEANDMRARAWAEIVASPAFRAFRAADNMVVELGGVSIMPKLSTDVNRVEVAPKANPKPRVRGIDGKPRLTQAEVGVAVLKALGPMDIATLTDMSKDYGAVVGGANPIANFRSTLSKDNRFYSFRHNGDHLWWLSDVPLPEGWDEAADDLLRNAASSFSSQEGGDGHAANNTNLN